MNMKPDPVAIILKKEKLITMPQVVELTFEELAKKLTSLEKEHADFKTKVKAMLDMQQAYFKKGKDPQILIKAKEMEKEVKELITPPVVKVAQSTMEFLGQ